VLYFIFIFRVQVLSFPAMLQ